MKKFVWWTVLVILLLSRTFAVAADQTMLQKAKKEGKVAFYANITAVAPIMTDFGNR